MDSAEHQESESHSANPKDAQRSSAGRDTGESPPRSDSEIGHVLDGRYRIDRLIGRGGMGTVYAATQLNLERPVAVKMLRKEYSKNKQFCARFMREAMALSRLSHPVVLHAYDHGLTADGRLYLVTELLKGRPLNRWVAAQPDKRVSTEHAVQILRQLAGALEAVHGFLVHRDLKPQNIMVEHLPDGVYVKLLDFGVVRPSRGSELTQGGMIGTPLYMSPEQINQDDDLDARADLYSLGVMGFELVAGHVPFSSEVRVEVLEAHLLQPPPELSALALPDAPAELIELITELLEKSPDDRPQTAGEVRARLEQIERRLIGSAEPSASPAEEAGSEPPVQEAASGPEEAPPTPAPARPRRRWLPRQIRRTQNAVLRVEAQPRPAAASRRLRRRSQIWGLLLALAAAAVWFGAWFESRPEPPVEGVIERLEGPFPAAEEPKAPAPAKVADVDPPKPPSAPVHKPTPAPAPRPRRRASRPRAKPRAPAPAPKPTPKAAPPVAPQAAPPAPAPPKLSTVRFSGIGPGGEAVELEVLRGAQVFSGAAGLKLAPGVHKLTIRTAGTRRTRSVEVDVKGDATIRVMAP